MNILLIKTLIYPRGKLKEMDDFLTLLGRMNFYLALMYTFTCEF